MSFWIAIGRIRSSTNARTVSWMCWCSSVRSRLNGAETCVLTGLLLRGVFDGHCSWPEALRLREQAA